MTTNQQSPQGMRTFTIIWIGQILSLLGTAVSNFGLTLWAFEASGGEATPLAWVGFFFTLPMVAFTPIVGVLVDRGNRKLMLLLSDLAAACATLIVFGLFVTGQLEIWHLYITAFISGTFQGFQWPAYSSAISTMLDKKDYTRASAMLQMVGPAANIFAPMIAGALIGPLGLWIVSAFPAMASGLPGKPGIVVLLALDLISATFAIGTLLFATIPQPKRSATGKQAQGNFLQEALFGFKYIWARPSLLGLQLVFLVGNLFASLGFAIYPAMILARSGSNEMLFGSIQTANAIGGIVGGLLIGAWGGFKRRIHGVLLGWAWSGLWMMATGVSHSLVPWLIASFLGMLVMSLINASNQGLWQAKVPPDVQGRVFATRRLIAWFVSPVSQFIAGPLADKVFEPAMRSDGVLAPLFGGLFGTDSGAGMALLFTIAGGFSMLAGIGGYFFPVVRNAEDLLPDHDETQMMETVENEIG